MYKQIGVCVCVCEHKTRIANHFYSVANGAATQYMNGMERGLSSRIHTDAAIKMVIISSGIRLCVCARA